MTLMFSHFNFLNEDVAVLKFDKNQVLPFFYLVKSICFQNDQNFTSCVGRLHYSGWSYIIADKAGLKKLENKTKQIIDKKIMIRKNKLRVLSDRTIKFEELGDSNKNSEKLQIFERKT